MIQKTWQRIMLLVCIMIICLSFTTYAALPEVTLDLPKDWKLQFEKMIFSEDGNKLAILLQESTPTKARAQAIFVYDFATKKWTRSMSLSEGVTWELEPLAFNYSGSMLAVRLRDTIVVIDTVKNVMTHHIEDVGSETEAVFSYNDRYLAFLMNAEWETPTSLALLDLQEKDPDKALGLCVQYDSDHKAAGPLQVGNNGALYYVEEFTWGSMNSYGVLKEYMIGQGMAEIFKTGSATNRVTNYYFSPDNQHLALVLRELSGNMKKSTYGLLIKTPNKFVYGQQLPKWLDAVEHSTSRLLSTAGWIGNDQFYWIYRTEKGSDLYVYSIAKDKVFEFHYDQQVYVSPNGVIIKVER